MPRKRDFAKAQQGNTKGRSHPPGIFGGLRALNNAADGSLRLAFMVKIDEK